MRPLSADYAERGEAVELLLLLLPYSWDYMASRLLRVLLCNDS